MLKFTKGKAWDPSNRDEGEGAEKRGRGIKIRCVYGGWGGGGGVNCAAGNKEE